MSKTGCIYCMYEELGEYEEPCRYCEDASEFRDKAGWIPCSERLPEATGEYLLQNEDNEMFVGHFDEDCGKFGEWHDWYDPGTLGFVDTDFVEYTTIIAWQPLPEPYKESED